MVASSRVCCARLPANYLYGYEMSKTHRRIMEAARTLSAVGSLTLQVLIAHHLGVL